LLRACRIQVPPRQCSTTGPCAAAYTRIESAGPGRKGIQRGALIVVFVLAGVLVLLTLALGVSTTHQGVPR
jgi:hypothetical protein